MLTIEHGAFAYNPYLKEITIPKSINSIYNNVFSNSPNLLASYYEGDVKKWQSIYKAPDWNLDSANYTIYCTDGQISKDGTVTYK